MAFLFLIIVGYLVGSIPFGLIIARIHGRDLRSTGSGNIGATNLSRLLGRKWGYFCFVLDVCKGLLPMASAAILLSEQSGAIELFGALGVGCSSIAGHIFPLYVRFRGGKGVATSFGVAVGFWPYYTICSFFAIFIL